MNENKMGTVEVRRLLLSMAAPMIMSMLVGALYNVVDSLFVSRYSEDALTAVSLAFPVQNVIIAAGTGIGVGVNSMLSRFLGENRLQDASKTALHGLVICGIAYLPVLFFGLLGSEWFYRIQTSDAQILELGDAYLSVIAVFGFGQMFQLVLEKLLQSTGRTAYTMWTQLVGAVLNLILDPILIFGYFGVPAMGTRGAAVATVTGQIAAMLLGVYFNLAKNRELDFSFAGFRLEGTYIKGICAVGIPTILMQSMSSVMSFGINKLLLAYTSTAAAVFGAYFKLQTFVYMAVFGLNNALIPIVAFNLGARKKDRIRQAILTSGCYSAVIGLIGTIVMQAVPGPIMAAFGASEEMMSMGITALRILSLSFVCGSISVMISYALQGLSCGVSSLVVSAARQVLVLLPLAWLFGNMMGITGIWIGYTLAEVLVMVGAVIFLNYYYKKKVNPVPEAGKQRLPEQLKI